MQALKYFEEAIGGLNSHTSTASFCQASGTSALVSDQWGVATGGGGGGSHSKMGGATILQLDPLLHPPRIHPMWPLKWSGFWVQCRSLGKGRCSCTAQACPRVNDAGGFLAISSSRGEVAWPCQVSKFEDPSKDFFYKIICLFLIMSLVSAYLDRVLEILRPAMQKSAVIWDGARACSVCSILRLKDAVCKYFAPPSGSISTSNSWRPCEGLSGSLVLDVGTAAWTHPSG